MLLISKQLLLYIFLLQCYNTSDMAFCFRGCVAISGTTTHFGNLSVFALLSCTFFYTNISMNCKQFRNLHVISSLSILWLSSAYKIIVRYISEKCNEVRWRSINNLLIIIFSLSDVKL